MKHHENHDFKKMRFDYLNTFLEVANSGSFHAAALKLGVSVSTISMQISAVEEFFCAKLIKRNTRGISLTNEGQIVYRRVEKILEDLTEIREDILRMRNHNLILVSGCAPGISLVPSIVEGFAETHPNLKLTMKLLDASTCLENIRNGKADIAVVGYLSEEISENEELEVDMLGDDEFILALPKNHKLLNQDKIFLGDVFKYPLVLLNERFGIMKLLKKLLEERGYSLDDANVAMEVEGVYSQLHAVSMGAGVAITSLIAAKSIEELGLIETREIFDFKMMRPLYLIYRKSLLENEDYRKLLDFFKKEAKSLLYRVVYASE